MYDALKRVVLASGVWDGKQAETHRFVLTPSVYGLTEARLEELRVLTSAIHEALVGIDRMATDAVQPDNDEPVWTIIRSALVTQVPQYDLSLLGANSGVGPGVFKFDLIEGADGQWWLPEIDTRVVQNWGVGVLTERMCRAVAPATQRVSDMARGVADEFRRVGGTSGDTLYLIYPDQERFYKPYFLLLRSALAELGAQMEVVHESRGAQVGAEGRFFVDLPFCRLNQELGEVLAMRYRAGEIRLLVPPKSHLGSKNVVALLCNVEKDGELEEILEEYVSAKALALLRGYIPESRLVHHPSSWKGVGQQYLLKEVISGGSKGVTLGDAPKFPAKVELARAEPFRFILQREVTTLVRELSFFGLNGELQRSEFGVRLIVHVNSVGEILDVQATACANGRNIHGGKSALMFGAAIV